MTAYQADKTQHARELAAAFKVALCIMDIPPENAGANVKPHGEYLGTVKCGRIIDDTTYAVALHEMGHVVAPCGGLPEERRRVTGAASLRVKLIEERAAWDWAMHYACDWTPAMEQVKQWALSTYETGYAQALQAEQNRTTAERRPQMAVSMDIGKFSKRMEG